MEIMVGDFRFDIEFFGELGDGILVIVILVLVGRYWGGLVFF